MVFFDLSPELQEEITSALAGSYTIERPLGAGGAAVVFSAHDRKHDRRVAIKVLRPLIAGTLGADRFLREIRLAARLTHPHILPLLDSGEAARLPYYVMPFVPGESLRDRLKVEKKLPISLAVSLTHEIADALDYAHAVGIVHRDIKPENVLLLGDHCVVADFGVARAMNAATDDETITSTGIAVGTPTYMSPEQAAGDPIIDGRSDLYSLATVLFEMLGGEPPFVGLTARAVIAMRFASRPKRVRELRPDVPEHIDDAIAKALEIEPEDRFANVAEFARALAGTSAPVPVIAQPEMPSIAVLPFENLSANPDNEYLADGIAEEIIGTLSRIRGLRVAARTSSFIFKGQRHDIRTYADQLRVANILEGSVQRAGNRLRTNTRLVETKGESQLWAERFDREITDVFEVQDEIARALANVLKVVLLGEGDNVSAVRGTKYPKAHDEYLRGRFLWNKRTEDALDRAADHFREAIKEDPEFALAYSGLADALVTLGIYGVKAPSEVMPLAKEAAERALVLDPSDASPHVTAGAIQALYEWNWPVSRDSFTRALKISPWHATAHHWYAIDYLVPQRRFADALEHLARARETDPLAPSIAATVGVVHYFARQYEDAIAAQRLVLTRDDAFAMSHYFVGTARRDSGEGERAVADFDRAIALTGGTPEMIAGLAQALKRVGRDDDACREFDKLAAMERNRYVAPSLFAQVHAAFGETDQALSRLDAAADARDADLIFLALRPVYDVLAGSARYQDVVRRVGVSGEG